MAGEVYARVVGPGGQQNALANFLSLKKVFQDAQRQYQIESIRDQRKQMLEEAKLKAEMPEREARARY